MKWLGQGISFIGLYIIYMGTFGQPGYHSFGLDWGMALGYMTVGGLVVAGGMAVAGAAMTGTQDEDDIKASEILRGVATGPFSLYLRAFDTSGKFVIKAAPGNIFTWDNYDRPGTDALERAFADAVVRTAPLVGLGGRGDVEFGLGGAGLLSGWKDKIRQAMKSATYIFVVPSANEGTLWEIGEIKATDHFRKTIFIMPPTDYPFEYQGTEPYADLWQRAREASLREHGVALPEYVSTGAIFRIDPTTQQVQRESLEDVSPRNVAKKVNALLAQSLA